MFKPPFTRRTLNKLKFFFFVQNVLPPGSLPTSLFYFQILYVWYLYYNDDKYYQNISKGRNF